MKRHRIIIAGLLFSCLISAVGATQYNVYVKVNHANLQADIAYWNHLLNESGTLKKYQIQPFLPQFPLHISLFLSAYEKTNLLRIKKRIGQIAKQQKSFCLYTGEPFLTAGGWLLLAMEQGNPNTKALNLLQHLSDTVVISLASLRDKNAAIPSWVQTNASKLRAFKAYGSPNVFFEFDPHLSLAGPPKKKDIQPQNFQRIMSDFIAKHPIRHHCLGIDNITIGEVNAQGQIIKEISHFKLPD